MLKWNCKSGCCDARSQQPLLFYTKNTPRSPCGERGAKTKLVFYCGKIPAKQVLCSRRSKVSASRPYAPDTRGVCFQGPSRALWYFKHPARRGSRAAAGEGMKSEVCANARLHVHHALFRAAGPQFRTAALRSNRQCGAAAPLICGSWVPPWLRPGGCRRNAYLYRSTSLVRWV